MTADLTAGQINLSDPGFWGRPFEERDAAFRVLRDQRPVAFFDEPPWPFLPPGPGYWALTRFADVVEASKNPAVFSSADGSVLPDLPAGGPPFSYMRSMIDMDNPGHADMRRIVARAFSPGAVRGLASQAVTLAHEIVDAVIEDGECDLAAQVAIPLPVGLVCHLLGVPKADWRWVRDRALLAYGRDDPEYVPGVIDEPERGALAVIQAVEEMADYMRQLSQAKRARPGDDLTSRLVRAEVAGRRLGEEELAQWFILLVVAGAETSRQAITHGVLMLDRHREQRRAWQQDFAGLAGTAVEEIVRWSSPVIAFRRTLRRDYVLSGQPLAEGDKVLLLYPSANRDEQSFAEPYRFDLRRTPNPHVGYGGPGPHYCLGAHLARCEISAMLGVLFERLPDLEITAEPEWLRSSSINGIKHLPVRFPPGRKREGRRA
jgi:methyl-branched lipid omega-hydroxylase